MNLLAQYQNGNTTVRIYDDGTKIRYYDETKPVQPQFPECIDLNVTNYCDMGCKFCYQNSSIDNPRIDLTQFFPLIDSIHPYTEVAINGNDIIHPSFSKLLQRCKQRNIIANITVNQKHFVQHYDLLKQWIEQRLVYGIGVSINGKPSDQLIELLRNTPNVVCHTIAGITTADDYMRLANNDLRVLVLGYKQVGRGVIYNSNHSKQVDNNIEWLYNNVQSLIDKFKVISFDNLALKQLDVKRFVKDWDRFYMGDDGDFTFYIDLAKRKYYRSSIESGSNGFDLSDDVQQMFQHIRSLAK